MYKVIIFSFAIIFFFTNCKKKETTKAYSPSCSGTKSFANDVSPLIQGNCVSCHSNYSTYTQIKASAASIRSSIVGGSMPKGNSLTEAQKNNIVCWIDAGMPNN
jgi:uncharacterized membrane protein